MESEIKEIISTLTELKIGNYTNGFIRDQLGSCIRKLNAIRNEMRASQNASTSNEALHIADVGEPLPTDFADWIADQDLYRYHDDWELDMEKFNTDELYAEFLKCYPTWSANG